jgi:hypothetical protein
LPSAIGVGREAATTPDCNWHTKQASTPEASLPSSVVAIQLQREMKGAECAVRPTISRHRVRVRIKRWEVFMIVAGYRPTG